ncbi:outer membrane beta-barrel protein [Sphingobacterium sp. SGL-16]|uniref:outer membrane beta-barrel protein n=1 Tax=Sphingobacterium sp. SGL-16 TaxID=2710883 RepID=UPI0013ECBF02|nr:outer membrane beta-barrel protein [Sphingobacterium sp. SGL-16]NGM73346.1 outer membrane beta-barrel protein [Sphingobacterium sp. SGL-16]
MNSNQLMSFLAFVLFFSISSSFAQIKLSGTIADAMDNVKLQKATIALLNPKDSILMKFSRTNESGNFTIPKLDTGQYKMIVSYPQYADYVQDVHILEDQNLGQIKLSKAFLLLEEVAVTGKLPIIIKGDTIEYNAASFKVDKDAKVEDLLKVLPGMTIDADGKITAQGKEVKKVLLDGEEFFGNDPTLITKNIRADMVDKVQVYEKKSDLNDRTGVDDGERTQTVNITLKEDKKKGAFGQVLSGYGADNYYGVKGMVNKFKGAQKIAAYAISANDGMVSLGFEDGQKYGAEGGLEMMEDGGYYFSSSGSSDGMDSWSGAYRGNGVPNALNLGASYTDKFKGDKHKLNVNYRRGQMEVENNSGSFVQNNLPQLASIQQSTGFSLNENTSHNANMRYDLKVDSTSDMTLKFGYNKINRDNFSRNNSLERNLEDKLLNDIYSTNDNTSINETLNANVMFTKRFKKLRRSLTLNTSISSNNTDGVSNYFSKSNLYQTNDSLLIDQLKNNVWENRNVNASLNYTEPLTKDLTATIGYTIGKIDSYTLNQSFNKNEGTGKYDILDQSLLNDFDNSNFRNSVNTGVNFKKTKFTLNMSNTLSFESLKRNYNNLNHALNRDQVIVNPSVSLNYQITKSKSLYLSYYGRTVQPDLGQFEPLKQNDNPLVNFLDNPDLESGFNNSIYGYFNSYKQLKDISVYFGADFNQYINPINSKVTFYTETGKRDIKYVNVNKSNISSSMYGGYRRPIWKKIALSMNVGANLGYQNNYNYLALPNTDSQLNNTENYSLSPNIGFSTYKANKWSFHANISPGYRISKSTLQPDLDINNFILSSYLDLSYTFPKDYKIVMNMQQSHEAATKTLPEFNVVNVSGYVSKKFLKDKSLEAQFFVNDLLNKNTGVRRYQSGYTFSQSTNDALRRYGMFKLIYNFTTMKGDN